jgi:hypothetical protein
MEEMPRIEDILGMPKEIEKKLPFYEYERDKVR